MPETPTLAPGLYRGNVGGRLWRHDELTWDAQQGGWVPRVALACQQPKLEYLAAHRDADRRLKRGERQALCATCERWKWTDERCDAWQAAPAWMAREGERE